MHFKYFATKPQNSCKNLTTEFKVIELDTEVWSKYNKELNFSKKYYIFPLFKCYFIFKFKISGFCENLQGYITCRTEVLVI